MNLSVKNILDVTKGDLVIGNENTECTNFSKDTRTIKKGDTYVGIKGEKFDGSLFWKQALENGANVVVINDIELNKGDIDYFANKEKTIIKVQDTILALGRMAQLKREMYGEELRVIGVTGSVGKTSTKDIIASVLSQRYKTLKTEGNNNNNIGLPFTILRLKDEEVAVIEMGMNHLGEINYLTKIAKPDISVITNIGTSHIGNLGSRENILKAKLEILDGMKRKVLIINNDNDLLHKWSLENHEDIEVHTFGIENKSEVHARDLSFESNETEFICDTIKSDFKVKVPVGGEHFVLNALCATAVGDLLELNNAEIKKGIEEFKLTAKRMEIHKLNNNVTVINDSYNASFESMKASISSLKNMVAKRRIAVLGDMFELGDYSEELHRKVGKEVVNNNIDLLYIIGNNSKYIGDEAKNNGYNEKNIYYFEDKEVLLQSLIKNIQSGDSILFKASNGMRLFDVVKKVERMIEND